ncbi:MAG TPA: choice-of-anchor D domain-containing protein, partial [Terriglobales bacterium]|nr:choice-of-anchor D domain-containing protein [Terriglobales bacterium]
MTPPRHWKNAAIAVITLAALILSGCNLSQSGKSNTSTNGTGTQASTHVGLNASSLDFGNVTVGTTKTMHISLTNSTAAGGASVTVSQIETTGTGFATPSTSSVELAPGQSTDIAVSFKPTASGNASGSLTIDVVGASDPASVPLDGNGTTTTSNGQLSVSPTQLSFGSVNVGSSKNLTETIQATNADVKISSAAWNGSGYSVSGITFPITIKAGTSKSFTVTFAPQSSGALTGRLSLTSDAANSPAKSAFDGT